MRHIARRLASLIACLLLAASFAVTLPGCNAVEGAGKDLQEASENTREAFSNDD